MVEWSPSVFAEGEFAFQNRVPIATPHLVGEGVEVWVWQCGSRLESHRGSQQEGREAQPGTRLCQPLCRAVSSRLRGETESLDLAASSTHSRVATTVHSLVHLLSVGRTAASTGRASIRARSEKRTASSETHSRSSGARRVMRRTGKFDRDSILRVYIGYPPGRNAYDGYQSSKVGQ